MADGPVLDVTPYRAAILDMDGVITDTADLHMAAWKRTFDGYLAERAERGDEEFRPFTQDDYREHVDGVPRYDGVARFLASRGIELPWGSPDDPPSAETVCGIGNRKNEIITAEIEEHGAVRYEGTVAFVRALHDAGLRTAVISSSRNAPVVLESAGVRDLFEAEVHGGIAAELGLAGKPAPDIFVEAASRLDLEPEVCIVVEDALSGVEAGRRGDFGYVIGVDRHGHPDDYRERGADLVVGDLGEIAITGGSR